MSDVVKWIAHEYRGCRVTRAEAIRLLETEGLSLADAIRVVTDVGLQTLREIQTHQPVSV